jgi:hypothetical protein
MIVRLHRGQSGLSSRLLRIVGPREPAPPETADHDRQDDQRTQVTDPLRSPNGPSSDGLVRDLTEPGYVRFPQSSRVGRVRTTTGGRDLVEQDQIGFPVRVGRLRGTTDRRGFVNEDQVELPIRSRRHRSPPLTRGPCKFLHARVRPSIQILKDLIVSSREPDERRILAAPIRMRGPCPGPKGLLDLFAATASRDAQGQVGIHECD